MFAAQQVVARRAKGILTGQPKEPEIGLVHWVGLKQRIRYKLLCQIAIDHCCWRQAGILQQIQPIILDMLNAQLYFLLQTTTTNGGCKAN